jgi:hypothetical protein
MDYQAQLNRKKKRYPIKLVNQDNLVYPNKLTNQDNLVYPNKLTNHANPIERQNKIKKNYKAKS